MESREITIADHDAVLELLTKCFGPSPKHLEGVERWSKSDDAQLLGMFDEEGCKSFGAVSLENFEAIFPSFRPWQHSLGELLETGSVHGSYNVLAVHPSERRRGLGNAIAEEQMRWFQRRGCYTLVGVAWIHPGPDRSRGLFRRFNYILVGRSSTFYPEMHRNRPCPYCGERCGCDAELYLRVLRLSEVSRQGP